MTNSSNKTPDASLRPAKLPGGNGVRYFVELLEKARTGTETLAGSENLIIHWNH